MNGLFNYYGAQRKPNGRPVGARGDVRRPLPITQPVTQPTPTQPTPEAATPTGSGIAATMQQSPYAGFLGGLQQPIDVPYQNLQQQRYNLMRGQIQGATRTGMEQMRTMMGGRGFRAGEAGIADVPIMQIAQRGQEQLGRGALGLAAEEARIAPELGLREAGLNLQRILGGGGLALAGEEAAQTRLMDYLRLISGTEAQRWQPYWGGVSGIYGG